MQYLVDTNILSEMVKARPNPGVIAFLKDKAFQLPSIVFAELAYGAYRLEHKRQERQKYLEFLDELQNKYQKLVVPVSMEIAALSGQLRAIESKQGRTLSFPDALIAATAIHRELVLVTRNVKDFELLNLRLLNPFSPA